MINELIVNVTTNKKCGLDKRNSIGMSHHNSNQQFQFEWLTFILKYIDLLPTLKGKSVIHCVLSLVFGSIFIF